MKTFSEFLEEQTRSGSVAVPALLATLFIKTLINGPVGPKNFAKQHGHEAPRTQHLSDDELRKGLEDTIQTNNQKPKNSDIKLPSDVNSIINSVPKVPFLLPVPAYVIDRRKRNENK